MIKPLATMLTMWGLLMFLITFFNFLNSPTNIDYNGGLKFSMVNTGMSFSFLISLILLIGGATLLKVSRVPRDV